MHPVAVVIFLAMRPSFALKMQSYVNETSSEDVAWFENWTSDSAWCGGYAAGDALELGSTWTHNMEACQKKCDGEWPNGEWAWAGCAVVGWDSNADLNCFFYPRAVLPCTGHLAGASILVKPEPPSCGPRWTHLPKKGCSGNARDVFDAGVGGRQYGVSLQECQTICTNTIEPKCAEINYDNMGRRCDLYKAGDCTRNEKNEGDWSPYVWETEPPCGGQNAKGDPHLLNIKGERFNVQRQGSAPLVKITSGNDAHLEVMALVEGVKQCQKKMFISQVNSSGSWLEKNVAVIVGEQGKSLSVLVDGQEVWSPASMGYVAPATENIIFNHASKFSIHEVTGKAISSKETGIEITTAHDVKMKIIRPLHRPTAPPHLNFDIEGLRNIQDSFMIGGLLGKDDHSFWTTQDEDCTQRFTRVEENEGSFAVAK